MSEEVDRLDEMLADTVGRVDANYFGQHVVQLAILTLLIDANLTTIEQAAERIEYLHRVSAERSPLYRGQEVANRVKVVAEWLRSHLRQPRGPWTPVVIEGGRAPESDT